MNYVSRMHGAAYMQFSAVVQLLKVFQFMNSSMNSQLNWLPFQIVFINTTSAHIGVVGWGWWGATGVEEKKHVWKLDIQVKSNKVLLCLKYHKKQPNQWITTTANHLVICDPVIACSEPPQPFQGHPNTIVHLTWLRKHAVPPKADLFTFGSVSVVVSQLIDKPIDWQ